ncbi:MAG: YceI family protein [Acidimicrobiales bacterium]
MTFDSHEPQPRRRTMLIWIGALAAIGVIAFGGFAVWFLRDDAPDEVSIDAAAQLVDEPATGGDDATATSDAGPVDISGTWRVDTSIGEFSYEDSTGTFVGFRIAEELSGIGSTEAIGRTPAVTGTLVADGTTITEVAIEADMTAITTNDSRRNNKVQDALDTDQFPTATFTLDEPVDVDDVALTGETTTIDATGQLTIHGVTQTVTLPLQARLVDDTIVVVGSLDITFADYDVEVPTAPVVLSVDDHGPLELQLFFTR